MKIVIKFEIVTLFDSLCLICTRRHIASPTMADNQESYGDRDRKSLTYLTKNFVDIMKKSDNGILNLRDVSCPCHPIIAALPQNYSN